ncbi:MAG: DUF4905 domain-containing protein [Marinoscillum sp.]
MDETSGKMVAEIRDEDKQEIFFHVVDFNTRTLSEAFWVEKVDWWTTSLRLYYPYLLLEQYCDPQNPTKKTLLVYELEKQEIFAEVPGFQFEELVGTEVQGYDPQQQDIRKAVELTDLKTDLTEKNNLSNPVYYHPGTESYEMVAGYLNLDQKDVGCEYFELEESIIISYYVRLGTKFERKLLVIKGDNEIYHNVVDKDLEGFASGGFFLLNDLVVFIENGYKINAIKI